MRRLTFPVALLISLWLVTSSTAGTLLVPSQYATIQGAIDAAGPGDTVLVSDGVYLETIATGFNDITIESVNGSAVTVIDGNGFAPVVSAGTGGGSLNLKGFTITGGFGSFGGGGIYCANLSHAFEDCVITGNDAFFGGGVFCNSGTAAFSDCVISNNTGLDGAGFYCGEAMPTLTNCRIEFNFANGSGGGMFNDAHAEPTLTNVVIEGNAANSVGGGMMNLSASPALDTVTLVGNSALSGGGMANESAAAPYMVGCTIEGNTAQEHGGGISNIGGSPFLSFCTIRDNSAGISGGGIYSDFGFPGVYDCTIDLNAAPTGGGIFNDLDVSIDIERCMIAANTADHGAGMADRAFTSTDVIDTTFSANSATTRGGGILCDGSSPDLTGCTITGNSSFDGGGIYCVAGAASLTSTLVTQNSALGDGGGMLVTIGSTAELTFVTFETNSADNFGGGLVCWQGSSPILVSCDFIDNFSDDGGGMGCEGGSNPSLLTCLFEDNRASFGGGMLCDHSSPTLDDCVFRANYGGGGGGGMFNQLESHPHIVNSLFELNSVSDNAGGGGIVNTADCHPLIESVTFNGNTAVNGGGMLNNFNSSPIVRNCTFINNEVSGYGGGVINWNGSSPRFEVANTFRSNIAEFGGGVFNLTDAHAYFENPTFDSNVSIFSGGGMVSYGNCDVIIDDGLFVDNESSTGGGAALIQFGCDGSFNGTTFMNNTAGTVGGAIIAFDDVRTAFNDAYFSGNTAAGDGGALYCEALADVVLNHAILSANSAGGRGGGIFCTGSSPIINFTAIDGNNSVGWGGACAGDDASPLLRGCTISSNVASIGGGVALKGGDPIVVSSIVRSNQSQASGGGVFLFPDTTATLANLTVTTNEAAIGGGISMDSGSSSLSNSIVWNNTGSSSDDEIRGTVLTVDASLVRGGYTGPGSGVIDADPLFDSSGQLALAAGSPAIDAGDYLLLPSGESLDLRENPRISGGQIDMGAIEFRSNAHHVPVDFATIQEAIDYASDGQSIVVSAGTYNEQINLGGKGISLMGAGGRGSVVIDATGLGGRAVHIPEPVNGSVVFEGFTITGGVSNEGGGIYAVGDVTIRNCMIQGNSAPNFGGGMYAARDVKVDSCVFDSNTAGTWGGGVDLGLSFGGERATFTGCTFTNCSAGGGGAVLAQAGSGIFVDCDFVGNSGVGAAYVFDYGYIECINCRITDNAGPGLFAFNGAFLRTYNCLVARNAGSGIHIGTFVQADIVNCTVVDNVASSAGGGLSINQHQSNTRIENCIVWGNEDHFLVLPEECQIFPWDCGCDPEFDICDCENRPDICVAEPPGTDQVNIYASSIGSVTMNNSCIQDGWPWPDGAGNITSDPGFVDALGLDGMPGTGDEDFNLTGASACIDIGDAEKLIIRRDDFDLDQDGDFAEFHPVDLADNERLRNGRIDAGAFEAVGGPTHSTWIATELAEWSMPGAWSPGPPPPGSNAVVDGIDGSVYAPDDVEFAGLRIDNGSLHFVGAINEMTLTGDVYGGPLQIGVWSQTPARFQFDLSHLYSTPGQTLQVGELGTLGGNGTIDIDIENGGSINPAGIGTGGWLTVNHNYVGRFIDPFGRETIGDITIDLISSSPPPPGSITGSHDVLNLGPEADLDEGSLTVRAAPGLNPSVGTIYEIIRVAFDRTGTFDVAFLPGLPGGKFFRVVYDYDPPTRGTTQYNVFLIVDTLGARIDFSSAGTYSIDGLATDTAVGDLNGDGHTDLAVTIPGDTPGSPGSVLVLYNGGTTAGAWNGWGSAAQYAVGVDPISLDIGQLDDNPGLDVAVLNRGDDSVSILTNNGVGLLTEEAVINGVADDGRSLIVFDADMDGDDDVALTGLTFDNTLGLGSPAGLGLLTVLINQTSLVTRTVAFGAPMVFAANDDPGDLDPGDFDNDKDPDLAIAGRGPRKVAIFLNELTGSPSFSEQRLIDVGSFPAQLQSDDLNGDNLPDIVTGNRDGQSVSVILNRTSGTTLDTTGASEFVLDDPVRSIVAVDLDQDGARGVGDLDLAVVLEDGAGDGYITVLRNDSTATVAAFTNIGTVASGANYLFVDAGDVDGDGQADLITVNDSDGARSSSGADRGGEPDDDTIAVLLNGAGFLCEGDANDDGSVNFADLEILLEGWGQTVAPGSEGDVNFSGFVDFADLEVLLESWGAICSDS